jgi:hypothetical protein
MAKGKTRISGCEMTTAAAYASEVNGEGFEVNIDEIKEVIDDYLTEAQELGKYSVAGLCITLGVTRETLDSWRSGNFFAKDVHDDSVTQNEGLMQCIEMGILHIERYWEECDKSAVQSKHVKMLERSGAFEEKRKRGIGTPPFDLGGLKKFSK